MILVTGGAGFIGANFVLDWLSASGEPVVNLDKLTYAGNHRNLATLDGDSRHIFVRGAIEDVVLVSHVLSTYQPRAIVHFAAESHVDRSIHEPAAFVETNVVGTFRLLEAARSYWGSLDEISRRSFRFVHVSTDEVYGSLQPDDARFTEDSPHRPNSPYAASKAASDHFARAWQHTYGLPIMITNCSNNYGRFQFPEKLIPLIIQRALSGEPLPVYGDGLHVRDWLYVGDHCSAIRRVLEAGAAGSTYNIGGLNEKPNLEVVRTICGLLDELQPDRAGPRSRLITHIEDRPGHDRRYAIDARKITQDLGWRPRESFETGLRKTVTWYMDNQRWVSDVSNGAYREWIERNYAARSSLLTE